jgi:hypothetical protein
MKWLIVNMVYNCFKLFRTTSRLSCGGIGQEFFYWDCWTCGVGKLSFCLEELNGIDECPIQWRRYVLEETRSKNGKPLKKLTLVYKNTFLDEFIEYLKPKIWRFVTHNFVARWQDKHFKTCVKSFPTNCIVSVVDFAKN